MSLLEEAKKIKTKSQMRLKCGNNEVIELSIAWLKKEVTGQQVSQVLNKKNNGNIVYMIAFALRKAYEQGLIKEKDK